jgi:hypothetical protein
MSFSNASNNEEIFEGGVFRIYSPSRPDLYFEIGVFDMANCDVDDILAARREIYYEYIDEPESVGPLYEIFEIGDVTIELMETFECPISEADDTIAEYNSIHQAYFDEERDQARNDAKHQYMTPDEFAIAWGMAELEEQIVWTAAA